MAIHNPYLDKEFFTDPAYKWYCECFLELAEDADCETINCTEGGILFSDHVAFRPLIDFLERSIALSKDA